MTRLPCGCRRTGYYIDESTMCKRHREWLADEEYKAYGYLNDRPGEDEAWEYDTSVELPASDPIGSHGVASAEARAERLCDDNLHHGSTPSYEYDA